MRILCAPVLRGEICAEGKLGVATAHAVTLSFGGHSGSGGRRRSVAAEILGIYCSVKLALECIVARLVTSPSGVKWRQLR